MANVKQFDVYLLTELIPEVKSHAADTEQSLSAADAPLEKEGNSHG